MLSCSVTTLSNARTYRYSGIAPRLVSSFVLGRDLTPSRYHLDAVICCTASSQDTNTLYFSRHRKVFLQVYLMFPLTVKQPHDLPPLRNAFVYQSAALATCIPTTICA